MGHKTPGSDLWDLGLRSQKLWEELAESLIEQGLDPLQLLGWKKTGLRFEGSFATAFVENTFVRKRF